MYDACTHDQSVLPDRHTSLTNSMYIPRYIEGKQPSFYLQIPYTTSPDAWTARDMKRLPAVTFRSLCIRVDAGMITCTARPACAFQSRNVA